MMAWVQHQQSMIHLLVSSLAALLLELKAPSAESRLDWIRKHISLHAGATLIKALQNPRSLRPPVQLERTGRAARAQIDPAILAQHDSFITRKAFNQRAPRFGLLEVSVGLFFETVLHESTPAQAF